MKHRLGPYELLSKLGTGGMAEVFKARKTFAPGIEKIVAVKRVLPPYVDRRDYANMFNHEAQIHASLTHPKLISFQGLAEQEGQWLLELEYFPSRNLRDFLDGLKTAQARLPWQAVVYIMTEVLDALEYVHHAHYQDQPLQIIHRDINPHNILISFEGWVKLSDFGISKSSLQQDTTVTGTMKGKIPYMSPEQLEGETLSQKSDLFSLGVVFFELLFDQNFFLKQTEALTAEAIRKTEPDWTNLPRNDFPSDLVDILRMLLEKNPTLRSETALEVRQNLIHLQDISWLEHPRQTFAKWIQAHFKKETYTHEESLVHTAVLPPSNPEATASKISSKNWFYASIAMITASTALIITAIRARPGSSLPKETVNSGLISAPITIPALPSSEAVKPVISKPEPKKKNPQLYLKGPLGATVYINGKLSGSIPLPPVSLKPGHYLILMKNYEGKTFMKKISLRSNQIASVVWEDF